MGSQEQAGLGAHAMWGHSPAQDLLQDAPIKGEVSVFNLRHHVCLIDIVVELGSRISLTLAVRCCGIPSLEQANILVCQPGDIGHVLRTISSRRRHPQHTINVRVVSDVRVS